MAHSHGVSNVNGGRYGIPASNNAIEVQLDGAAYGFNQPGGTTGTGANNMQPYSGLNYMIKAS